MGNTVEVRVLSSAPIFSFLNLLEDYIMAAIGIDLGTTNSLICVFQEGEPKLIPNSLGDYLTPSVVGVDEAGVVIVGQVAKDRLVSHPELTVATFKRLMGTDKVTKLKQHSFRPEELSALILKSLKADAESYLKEEIIEAVISVPAYFNDQQRKATIDAAHLAGLKVERLINEPTAAALAYGLQEKDEGQFFVFDLGGGTFDVSILDKYHGVMEVRSTAGDTYLGGEDFTDMLELLLARKLQIERGELSVHDHSRLTREAERLKVALSKELSTAFDVSLNGKPQAGHVSRDEFEIEATLLLKRLRAPMERAINDAGLNPAELDAVVLVGGATRMPMIRSLVSRLMGRLPLAHLDPDTTIAKGACVQAALKQRDAALEDVVMTDVCPFTLGIASFDFALQSNTLSAIIARNATVPISREQHYSTMQPGQKYIKVAVYQGENMRPEQNVLIGEFNVDVPYNPKDHESIAVRFTYDVNGVLQVEVTVVSTKQVISKIFRNQSGLSEEELKVRFKALAALQMHPRDGAENQAIVARAERIYAESHDAIREQIKGDLGVFLRILDKQIDREIREARVVLSKQLDAYERGRFNLE